MNIPNWLLYLAFLGLGLASCKQDATTTGMLAPDVTGDLVGRVTVLDDHGAAMTNASGVLVQCEGTSFQTISDSTGTWLLHGLPTRTYSISFSKPGCYTWRNRSFSFVAGGVVRYSSTPTIGWIPAFTVTLDALIMPSVKFNDSSQTNVSKNGAIYAHTSANAPYTIQYPTYCFFGTKPGIDPGDPSTFISYLAMGKTTFPTKDSVISMLSTLSPSNLTQLGLRKGDTVYFRAYPTINPAGIVDPLTGKSTLVGLGPTPSNTLSAVVE